LKQCKNCSINPTGHAYILEIILPTYSKLLSCGWLFDAPWPVEYLFVDCSDEVRVVVTLFDCDDCTIGSSIGKNPVSSSDASSSSSSLSVSI